ncbi:acetyl-CoA carboxylase biotin carboxyl carrier protein [Novosphingobium percolationis]|uniref:acetyl-CoA carboxylase biotin carboxyl carrier protein n=1 Tax=Novosphingobium percolationis TaxID=2871811 RepID=UPI001CD21F6A|nr:biotin/lipoyl-containing protein [Novosphingobium percolationis]
MANRISGDIAKLAELFASGGFKELRVEGSDFGVLLSNDSAAPRLGAAPAVAAAPAIPVAPASTAAPAPADAPSPVAAPVATDASWHQVCAPNLGTFYRAPKPGSAPFVEVGQRVHAETEICLLEVMKLFTSVKAGKAGTIRRVCVEDGVLVEGGQVLFLVEAD